jgi:hypothetical protein
MSPKVEFAYSLKEQAALNARMCRLLYGPFGRWTLMAAPVFAALAALGLAAILARIITPANATLSFLVLILFFVWPAIWAAGRLNTQLARRVSRASTLDGAACVLEARPEHLLWTGPDWRTEIAWSSVDRVDDGPQAVMFVFRGVGYFAPRRAFADDETRKAFIQECAKHLTPEARLRSGLAD